MTGSYELPLEPKIAKTLVQAENQGRNPASISVDGTESCCQDYTDIGTQPSQSGTQHFVAKSSGYTTL